MECISCKVCHRVYCEENCLPKILECGHSVCSSCLTSLLQDKKNCPICDSELSNPLEEYITNLDFLKIPKMILENSSIDLHELCSLETKKKFLLSMKEISEKLIEERSSFKKAATDLLGKLNNNNDDEQLIANIDQHIGKIDKVFCCTCNPTTGNILHFNKYKDKRHFLCDLGVRLHNDEKIFACEMVGNLGWKYGRITFSDDQFHVHCLSFSTPEKDASLVLLQDVRKCIESKDDFKLFISVGEQKLFFSLTEDSSVPTLQLIKFCTGEAGQFLKGRNTIITEYNSKSAEVSKHIFDSENLNCCCIDISTKVMGFGYEHSLLQTNKSSVDKDDIIIQCLKGVIYILKTSENSRSKLNVVGKLHEDSSINFKEMKKKEVEDCGISFSLK